jgi:hypothetical protein
MPVRSVLALTVASVVVAACDSGSSRRDPLLASATIGPAGGEVEVVGGAQDGWRLDVPAGALAEPTELRVYAADLPAVVEAVAETSTAPVPAPAFRIEPVGLQLAVRATLRAPYRPTALTNTAPGNVRLREARNGNAIDVVPDVIDVDSGRIEAPVRFLGSYQVIAGPRAASITDYWQPVGASVALEGGRTFAVELPDAGSPFAATCDRRWRYEGPHGVDLLHFAFDALRGREAPDESWREVWSEPFAAWQFAGGAPPPQATTLTMQVQAPIGGPSIGAQMTVQAQWTWDEPQPVGDTLATDVVRLWITLTWNRVDLGVGTRDYRFWFAPGLGLVALAEDGVVHRRTGP